MTAQRLELEAKEVEGKAARAEVEKDVAHHETAGARLEFEAAGHAWAQVESELARVHCAYLGRWPAEG